jgi:hypothetical protein
MVDGTMLKLDRVGHPDALNRMEAERSRCGDIPVYHGRRILSWQRKEAYGSL